MNILDGIKTANIKITKEMQKLSELVKDKSRIKYKEYYKIFSNNWNINI